MDHINLTKDKLLALYAPKVNTVLTDQYSQCSVLLVLTTHQKGKSFSQTASSVPRIISAQFSDSLTIRTRDSLQLSMVICHLSEANTHRN